MKIKIFSLILGGCTVLALASCGDVRETVGLTAKPPDEFAVVDHPPLTLPPDYSLKAPRPGVENSAGNSPSEKAAQALFGEDKMKLVQQQGVSKLDVRSLSASEQALITQSGAANADRSIRSQLVREGEVSANKKLLDDLLFWKKPKEPGTVVDPVAEAQRLKNAKAQGQPLSTGVTTAYEGSKQKEIQ